MREYWLDPPELSDPPECPVCKCECSDYYFDVNGEIVGCDCCITSRSAAEVLEEEAELARDYADEQRAEAFREAWYE